MPYVFPYEELFVYTIATTIVALLYLRVRIAMRRRRPPGVHDAGPPPPS